MKDAVSEKDMLIAEDALIADVQFVTHNLLSHKAISRSDLARRMNVSEAYVSQLFKDTTRNLTLKTVARIFCALGEEAQFTSETMEILAPRRTHKKSQKSGSISFVLNNVLANDPYTQCNDNEYEGDLVAA